MARESCPALAEAYSSFQRTITRAPNGNCFSLEKILGMTQVERIHSCTLLHKKLSTLVHAFNRCFPIVWRIKVVSVLVETNNCNGPRRACPRSIWKHESQSFGELAVCIKFTEKLELVWKWKLSDKILFKTHLTIEAARAVTIVQVDSTLYINVCRVIRVRGSWIQITRMFSGIREAFVLLIAESRRIRVLRGNVVCVDT